MTLIKREDAIDAICKEWCYVTYGNCPHVDDGFVCDGCDDVKALNALPSADVVSREEYERLGALYDAIRIYDSSAEAVQGWIPCSERLPEKGELVLVTVWNDVTIAWRNIYGGWDSAEDMYEKGDVIAWMPLPKPYREDGEE